jgi:polyribonucleotide nucleotidyltransferase
MPKKEYSIEIGGKKLVAEFSDLASKTNGSVMLRYGETVVLATVVMSKETRNGIDYFPLSVDFEEKFYAAGQILGSRFVRRETKPTDEAVLTGRVIDRTIRPFFASHIRNEVQVVVTVLSIDKDDPDVLAINAASLALGVSDIPWGGPVGAVRISRKKGERAYTINPVYDLREHDDLELELVVASRDGHIVMIEGWGQEIPEDIAHEAISEAVKEINRLEEFQKTIIKDIGKKKLTIEKQEISNEAKKLFAEKIEPELNIVMWGNSGSAKLDALKEQWVLLFKEAHPEEHDDPALQYYEERTNDILHCGVLERGVRPDGRNMDEIRPLFAQAGGISRVIHGSGLFYRGETHVLSVLTLGGPNDSQIIDGIEVKTKKRFMHHYNFPPFSSGETGKMGVNRRMIGHGALAEKAIAPVLPPKEKFPYTIRIVSESMASNGSTSMASVCAGTLSLLDAGVPIKTPVAGIAMGLMVRDDDHYKVLTDIQGPEDHYGDMDLKVAGTQNGITAIQLDIKVDGIPLSILGEAFTKAQKARLHILNVISAALPAPRENIAPSAPKIISISIKPDQIGLVIGPAGKTINKIKDETGAEIDIEDDGTVFITGKNGTAEKARDIINVMTREFEVGERFEGVVTKILDFGAIVKISPTADGLVHISEIAPFQIDRMESILKEGDRVPVVIKEIDKNRGRIALSIKRADPDFADKKIASFRNNQQS